MMAGMLWNIVAAFVAGAMAKKVGQSPKTGPLEMQKVLAPAAAVAAATAVEYGKQMFGADPGATIASINIAGATAGGLAIGIYSTAKNLIQLIRQFVAAVKAKG